VCTIVAGGQAYCWGLGGGTASQGAPVLVVGGTGLLAVSAGASASCGLGADGTAVCWGSWTSGGANAGATPYRSISVGNASACGVSGTGTVYCWGGSSLAIASPVRFVEVSAGAAATCGLTGDGKAWCWGSNSSGAVGAGDWTIASTAPANVTPRPVSGGLTFRSLSSGYTHVCGLTTSGTAYCWGSNYQGQLGDGAGANVNAPVPVAGGLTFADISAGTQHTCAVTTAGAACCWGSNAFGQLGDSTISDTPRTTPTPVTGGLAFVSVSAGESSTCGIAVGGAAYCWGSNGSGQLGTGTIGGPAVSVPTAVTGGLLFQPAPPALAPHRVPPQR
jgi:alpha-tubulin suppressor-like RCC1 family protein